MCEIEIEGSEVFIEEPIKARKNHACGCCGGQILKGEIYTRHFSVHFGEINSQKMCAACKKERDEFVDEHDVIPCPDNFLEMLDECVQSRESFSQMLHWSRMARRIENRRPARGEDLK